MKFLIRLVAGLFAALLLLIVGIFIFVGFTDSGANFAVQQVTKRISSPDLGIRVGRVSAPLTGHLTVESVEISDLHGPYLAIDDVDLRWSPMALLKRRFSAESLSAAAIDLKRLPAGGEKKEPDTTKSSGGFSLPIGIAVDHFDLPKIDIGEAVIGEAFPLSASGSVAALQNRITAILDAEHRAKPSTYLKADIAYVPDENRLDIEAEINEPEGGMVVTLLKLPDAPALNVKVDGDGTLSDWAGKIDARLAGNELGSINVGHRLSDSGERNLSVDGTGQFAPLAPEQFRSLIEGTTRLDVAVAISPAGRISIDRGNVSTGSFTLNASGAYDPKGQNDLKATLAGTDGPVPFSWPLGEDMLALTLRGADLSLSGNAQNAALDAAVTLGSVSMAQGKASNIVLNANGTGLNVQNRTGKINTKLTIGGVQLANESLSPFVKAPITLEAPIELARSSITIDPATLESGSIGATVNTTYDLDKNEASGHAKIFILADALPAATSRMINGVSRIESDFTADTAGNVALTNLDIENNLARTTGNLSISDGKIDTSLKAEISNLALLADQVSGAASVSVSAKGALTAPNVDAEITAQELTISGEKLVNFTLTAKGLADLNAPAGSLKATGTYSNAPLSLGANVSSENGLISVAGIRGEVGGNTLSGDITLNARYLPSGKLDFNFPDLKLLAGLAGQDASGSISGNIQLNNANDALAVALQAKSDSVGFGDIRARTINADISVTDIAALKASGSVRVGALALAGKTISNIALTAQNQGDATSFDVSARYENDPVAAAATVRRGDNMEIDLTRLEGTPMALDLRLLEPGRIVISNGVTNIQTLKIGIGGGSVSASGTAGQTLNLKVAIAGVSAGLANQFMPSLGAEGALSGTVTVSGAASSPVVDYNATLSGGTVAQLKKLGAAPITITTRGRYADNRVTTDTALNSASGLNISANGSVGLTNGMPLNIAVKGALPMAIASAAAADAGFAVSGSGDVDLVVSGQAANPLFNGAVNLKVSAFTDLRRGISLNNLTGRLVFNGTRIVTENISGRMSGGGTVSVDGTIDLTGQFPAALKLTADNAVVSDGTLVSTTVNGAISLDGPLLGEPTVSGRINLSKTAITIPERLPASISEITIINENASAAVLRQAAAVTPRPVTEARTSIRLDITVSAPNAIFIRGRGVDAELGGEVRITGTAINPIVSGGFELIRGRLSVLNRRLDFTSGHITFGGSLVPLIDMTATTSAGNTTINISLQGVATDPQVELTSSPALPQDEILAQLLFNQSSSSLSALQIAQLADAVIQLTGGTNQSLFGSLRQVLGFDNLDITTDDQGNASVSVGKYLNQNTYVEVEQSQDTGTKASVNIDLGRNFIVKGSAGSRGEASGGIYYEREY